MTKLINTYLPAGLFIFLLAFVTGCVDQDFDTPPLNGEDPEIPAESIMTIRELKAMHTFGEIEDLTTDKYISGVVVADDRSGNFYKQLIIEDETAGIPIIIDAVNMYNNFPVGRRLFVKLNGLYLGDYNGLIQLAGQRVGNETDRLPEALIDEHILRGQYGLEVMPTVVTFAELTEERLGSLIKLENVQFNENDVQVTYAIAEGEDGEPENVNRTIDFCDGGSIIVRTSGYSDFVSELTPEGMGSITAIYTTFGSTKQLIIRDPSDVDMANERCDGAGGSGTGTVEGELMTIGELRNTFTGGEMAAPAGRKISGVVISEHSSGNFNGQNLVIQSGDTGITVRFTDFHNYREGDVVEVATTDGMLSEYRGLLQMANVELSNSAKTGTGSVQPFTMTIEDYLEASRDFESTLVRFENVLMSKDNGSSDYAFSVNLNDGTGTCIMFTYTGADFANADFPTDSLTVTGVAGIYDGTPQIYIRNLDDVEVTGGSGGGGTGGGDMEEISISDLRAAFTGSAGAAPSNKKMVGTVISDRTSGNIHSRNLVIQDGAAGIVVRFDEDHTFNMGEQIEVETNGADLDEYNGLLQLNNTPIGNAVVVGSGSVSPQNITIGEYMANARDYESELVQFSDVTLSNSDGSSGYGNSTEVTDGSNTVLMYTRGDATFSGNPLPSGSVTVTAIGSVFNSPQINIRNTDDVN